MRLLIAEDDPTSRLMLATVLRKAGHEVVPAADGAEAWAILQRSDAPRLAILDWMMPEMDGLEVCRRVRARETDVPPYVLMLTTKGEKSDIIAGLAAGANDYLPKPFDAGELRARVEVGRRMVDLETRLVLQAAELRSALDHIRSLEGVLPICMHCKRIRDDQGGWSQVETYVASHSEATFSHGICPTCLIAHYGVEHEEQAS
jgi:phosphoserine phosphatase RsbU/P